MTIHLSAGFTHALATQFDMYHELKRVLDMWGLTTLQLNTSRHDVIERVGALCKRMSKCEQDAEGCFAWNVPVQDLAAAITLLTTVSNDLGLGVIGITRID
jgi:hypothetical protein